jgi:hypothetical protein
MPAGQSIVGICNIGLIALGEDPITALTDPTKRAILCSARYNDVRQAAIRNYGFGCCKALTKLAAAATAPAFDWQVQYTLPADYIRVYGIMDVQGNTLDSAEWEIVGPYLMTDQGGPLPLMYFFDLQDTTRMDALMSTVIGYELALEIAPAITRDEAKLARVTKMRDDKLRDGRFASAIEDSTKEWDVDILLRSRR